MANNKTILLCAGLLLAGACGDNITPKPHVDVKPDFGFVLPEGNSVLLHVQDELGNGVSTASLTVAGAGDQPALTDGVGRHLFENLPDGSMLVKVERPGYTSASVKLDIPAGDLSSRIRGGDEMSDVVNLGVEVRLHSTGDPVTFDAADGRDIMVGDARVIIPAGRLVDRHGQPVTGIVNATVVPMNVITMDTRAFPGPSTGITQLGQEVFLAFVAMVDVVLTQDGLPVDIAPGSFATLELKLPVGAEARYQKGQSIDAWWLDLDAGTWRQEGAGMIIAALDDPARLAWSANVAHFTAWSGAIEFEPSCVFVKTIGSEDGDPVSGVRVDIDIGYKSYVSSTDWGLSDQDGRVCLNILDEDLSGKIMAQGGMVDQAFRHMDVGEKGNCWDTNPTCAKTITLSVDRPVCISGSTLPCEDPEWSTDLVGVGRCRRGSRQCDTSGLKFSECQGEVGPETETCNTYYDDDCDGEVNEYGADDCTCDEASPSKECYSGPEGTKDVGACKAGTQSCDLDGGPTRGSYAECVDEVTPRLEDCATDTEDLNCDGQVGCTGASKWSIAGTSSSSSSSVTQDVALEEKPSDLDDPINAVAVGNFRGSVNFGSMPFSSNGSNDIFVVKLRHDGGYAWQKRFGGTGSDIANAVAIDASGDILITGSFNDVVDFGGKTLTSAGLSDVFVLKLKSDGEVNWVKSFGGSELDSAKGIAIDGQKNIYVAGTFRGSAAFGNTLDSNGGNDIFLMKLSSNDGSVIGTSRRYGVLLHL